VLASVLLLGQALRHEAALLLAAGPEMTVQRLVAGRHELAPAAYMRPLEKIRGVTIVRGRLWGYYYDPAIAANYTLLVPAADPPARGRIQVGAALAQTRGLAVGDVLSLRSHTGKPYPFTVAALFSCDSSPLTADLILVNEEDFRAFFGIPAGLYTDLVLTVRNPNEVRTIAEKVLRAPRHATHRARRDPAHLRGPVRLVGRHGHGAALRRRPGVHHLRLRKAFNQGRHNELRRSAA
jgi:hypothetical protein